MATLRNIPLDKGYAILLKDLGLDPEKTLDSIGLPKEWAHENGVKLNLDEFYRLWQAIEDASATEALPIAIAKALTLETMDAPIFAALHCQNFLSAVKRIVAYKKLVAPIMIDVDETSTTLSISIDWPQINAPTPTILFTCALTYFMQLFRIATRHDVRPLRVEYRDKLTTLEKYTNFFGIEPKKGKHYRLEFSIKDAKTNFLTADPRVWNFYESELKSELKQLEASTALVDLVRLALFESLPSGQCSLEHISQKLNINARTLQRQLSLKSLSYLSILNDTRQMLANYYLQQTDFNNTEISLLLGFREPNSFIRAFKQWTGKPPLESKLISKSDLRKTSKIEKAC